MKKIFRSFICAVLVVCQLSSLIFTGNVFGLSDNIVNIRDGFIAAINDLDVTADTTADDIIAAVTSVDSDADVVWKVAFTKILPTNGAIITLNGTEVDGGVVRAHDGSIKGILNITSEGKNFDVAVDFTLKATYETINCTKQATINNIPTDNSTYAENAGYVADADLVIIERTGGVWNISNNFFKDNTTIKAVIAKTTIANCMSNSFRGTSALQAVVFNGRVSSIQTQAFWASKVKYIEFSEPAETTSKLNIDTNAFGYSTVNNLYISSFPMLKIGNGAFVGAKSLQQLRVDGASINTIANSSLLTHETRSIATVVCNDAATASKFTASGALATIDVSKTAIVDYYRAVSQIKVVQDSTVADVIAEADKLDANNQFTVTAKKGDNVFKVSITDSNSITATTYLKFLIYSEENADIYANTVQNALNNLEVNCDTTANDIVEAVTSLYSDAVVIWKVEFTKIMPTNGAIITLNGTKVDGGVVRAHDGSIKGVLNITAEGTNFDVVVNLILEASYETIDCTKKATINNIPTDTSTFAENDGYVADADLVIIERTGGVWNISKNFFKDNTTIKAVIAKTTIANCMENSFRGTSSLQAVVFNSRVSSIQTQAFWASNVKYIEFSEPIETTTKLNIGTNAFGYSAVNNLYIGAFPALKIDTNAFVGARNLKQLIVDTTNINTIASNSLLTNVNSSITTLVCPNSTVAQKFVVASTIDLSKTAIVDYCSAVSKIKVVDDSTISDFISEADRLDTDNEFTVTAEKKDNVFKVSITDANSITATIFINVLTYSEDDADSYANTVQNMLDNLEVNRDTTADDIVDSVTNAINDENVSFVWVDPFKKITPVDSADIYLDDKLIASADRQDGSICATLGLIIGKYTRLVFLEKELPATIERISYTAADKAPDSAFTLDGKTLTGYKGSYKLVIIPKTVTKLPIESPLSNSKHADLNHGDCNCIDSIETVIIGENVTYIDYVTLSGASNLKVAIVNSSAKLNGMNFRECKSLKYVKLSDDITKVGEKAFYGCESLKALKLPSKLTELGENALTNSGLKEVILPETVTTLGNNATKGITVYGKGETPRFDDAVRKAKEYFNNIPLRFEKADMLADSLKSIITNYDVRITSFKRTDSNLNVMADIVASKDAREYVYTISGNKAIPTHNLDAIIQKIEDTIDSMNITNNTTSNELMTNIISAVNDDRVDIIYVQDFDKVRAINGANVNLSGNLVGSVPAVDGRITAVLGVKFKGDKATVLIDEKITPTIENYNYNSKAADSDFVIENGTLKSYTGTSELVVIPSTVTKIGVSVFGKNESVKAIVVPDTVISADWSTFNACSKLEVAVLSDKISKLPGANFKNCESLKYVKLPSGLQRIGEECFFNTHKMETIKLPDSLVYVDRRAFCNSGLYEITLPASVEIIYDQAFRAQDGSLKHLDKITILSDKVEYNTGKNIEEHKDPSTALPIFGYGHEIKLFCRSGSTTEKLYNSMTFSKAYEGLLLCEYIDQTYLDAVYTTQKIVSNMYSDTETAKLLKSFIEKEIINENVSVKISSFKYDKVNIFASVKVLITVDGEEWAVDLNGNKKVLISGYDQLINAAQKAINNMTITDETTKEDIEAAVKAAIDSGTAEIKWSVDFAKRKSVYGAVVKVKDQSWDIPGVEGKVAGYINITFKGKNQNLKLERIIAPEIEVLKYNTVSKESEFEIVNDKVFEYKGNAEVVVVPKAETIVMSCFRAKPGIKVLILPEGMPGVQSQAFQEMPDLRAVYISDSCTDLGISRNRPDHEGAALFNKCPNLKYVRLSPYTTEIPFYTFNKCYSLTEFYIPEGITKIGHRAFWCVCENLEDLVLPSTLTQIGSYTFAGNNAEGTTSLNNITILSDNLEYFKQTEDSPNAGPFACYSNKAVNINYPSGAKPNYLDERLGRYNFKIETNEVTQTLSQAAIDLQRLLNDYPITNETTKEIMNAAINKLITNNQIKYKWTKDYTKVDCDDENAGSATGTIVLTDSKTKLTFTVTLNKSISASTFVDNRTITIYDADPEEDNWDDDSNANNEIDGQNNNNILLYVIIGAASLLLLTGGTIGTIVLIKKRKAKKN